MTMVFDAPAGLTAPLSPTHPQNHRWPNFETIPAKAGVVIEPLGGAYRVISKHTGERAIRDGVVVYQRRAVRRSVALSRDEARAASKAGIPTDYYSPTLGWIRHGLKMEREAFLAPPATGDDPNISWEVAPEADAAAILGQKP